MVAQCLAEQGDGAAHAFAIKLQEINPGEAQAIEARLLWRQDHFEEAGAMLRQALKTFRSDPWTPVALMERTLKLAEEFARVEKQKLAAPLLFRALEKPFAVYAADELRTTSLLHVGMDIDQGKIGEYTLRGVRAAEPYVPWQLNFLKVRSACYASFQEPLAALAKKELAEYVSADPNSGETKGYAEIAPPDRLATAEDP